MPVSKHSAFRRGTHLVSDRFRRLLAGLAPLVSPSLRCCPDGRATLPPDRIPWDVRPPPQRVVAVGDIQGDLVALASILDDRQLIDQDGHWTGGPGHLVLNGDLVGDNHDSRLLMDFVIRLEEEAAKAGGAVHALLGNHDILALGRIGRSRRQAERRLFRRHPVTGAPTAAYQDAFRGDTAYAQWLRRRNAIVKIGQVIFAHAGVNRWLLHHHPSRVNATIRAWIRYWQGVADEPDHRSRWAVGHFASDPGPEPDGLPPRDVVFNARDTGPLWTRAYKPVTNRKNKYTGEKHPAAPENDELREILDKYGAQRLVIGHNPVRGKEVLLAHPYHGDMVVMIDTRISARKGGALTCLEIENGEMQPHSAQRSETGRRVRRLELRRLREHAADPETASKEIDGSPERVEPVWHSRELG